MRRGRGREGGREGREGGREGGRGGREGGREKERERGRERERERDREGQNDERRNGFDGKDRDTPKQRADSDIRQHTLPLRHYQVHTVSKKREGKKKS